MPTTVAHTSDPLRQSARSSNQRPKVMPANTPLTSSANNQIARTSNASGIPITVNMSSNATNGVTIATSTPQPMLPPGRFIITLVVRSTSFGATSVSTSPTTKEAPSQ